jgi:hypothetical protein
MRVASIARVTVPAELTTLGATVTGLEPRVHMHVHSRQVPLNRYSSTGGYWFDDLKQAYNYPSDRTFDGTGANVGVLMSSDVLDSDTRAAFCAREVHGNLRQDAAGAQTGLRWAEAEACAATHLTKRTSTCNVAGQRAGRASVSLQHPRSERRIGHRRLRPSRRRQYRLLRTRQSQRRAAGEFSNQVLPSRNTRLQRRRTRARGHSWLQSDRRRRVALYAEFPRHTAGSACRRPETLSNP